jgi:hypothetical protein
VPTRRDAAASLVMMSGTAAQRERIDEIVDALLDADPLRRWLGIHAADWPYDDFAWHPERNELWRVRWAYRGLELTYIAEQLCVYDPRTPKRWHADVNAWPRRVTQQGDAVRPHETEPFWGVAGADGRVWCLFEHDPFALNFRHLAEHTVDTKGIWT